MVEEREVRKCSACVSCHAMSMMHSLHKAQMAGTAYRCRSEFFRNWVFLEHTCRALHARMPCAGKVTRRMAAESSMSTSHAVRH
jgi:hypothetical protein